MSAADELAVWFSQLRRASFSWRDLQGIDRWETYSPTRTGYTEVGGAPTLSGRFVTHGRLCFVQIKIVPVTTIASVGDTSYCALPLAPAGFGGQMQVNSTTVVATAGLCRIDVTNKRVYTPTWVASGNTFVITGSFEV